MAVIGKIDEFELKSGDWPAYVEQLEAFFIANDVADVKKPHVLLSVVGKDTYLLLRNLCAPDKPASKTYDALVTKVQEHVAPAKNEVVERYRFSTRKQGENETIMEYVAELKRLAMTCNFGGQLNTQLRDKFVSGISSKDILKRLLSEKKLTFEKAFELATTIEVARNDATEIKDKKEASLHKLSDDKHRNNFNFKKRFPPPTKHERNEAGQDKKSCFRCGKVGHLPFKCFALSKKCNYCKQIGHYEICCRNKKGGQQCKKNNQATNYLEQCGEDDVELPFLRLESKADGPLIVKINIGNIAVSAELDTGAAVNVMTVREYESSFQEWKLSPASIVLKTYDGSRIKPKGKFSATIRYGDQVGDQSFYVVDGVGPVILGRSWLKTFKVEWSNFNKIETCYTLETILARHKSLFDGGVGEYKKKKFKLYIDGNVKPKHFKPRTIPYAMYSQAEKELERLEREGVIEKIDHSEWATPVVYVPKSNGSVRMCGDYKMTINPHLKPHKYPMPRIEKVFDKLRGGKKFTKIDQRFAYMQLILDEGSQELVVITTHLGLFRVKRLPFGVTVAAELFQEVIDELTRDLEGVGSFQDDTIVTGDDDQHHLRNLNELLQRYRDSGLKLNRDKCVFMADAVDFLGHRISKDGVRPLDDKIKAIVEMRAPWDVSQLRAFLGMVNFYGKFIKNLATVLGPLHHLLRGDVTWKWSSECENSFNKVKKMLLNADALMYFDESLPVELFCDASSIGMGAVLVHRISEADFRPIAFASRTFNAAERNYSQIDKEARALIFGIKKFHDYLWGRHFVLWTDHRPLCSLFSPIKGIPERAAARMQRWALFLQSYDFEIKYLKSSENTIADALSRLPLIAPTTKSDQDECQELFLKSIEVLPITSKQIKLETRRDKTLSKVLDYVMYGWSGHDPDDEVRAFFRRRDELSTELGCIVWGNRVVIPSSLRKEILTELHSGHPGMARMKALARSHVWWPNLDGDIEDTVRRCDSCQELSRNPPTVKLHPWEYPTGPWKRIHTDMAGPIFGRMYLLIVDAYSKWPEVYTLNTTKSSEIIKIFKDLFVRYGLPEVIVSDNGTPYRSQEFADFIKSSCVVHKFSAPYHPATNGAAENFVGTFKKAILADIKKGKPAEDACRNFIGVYRVTPHCTTTVTPASLMLKRELRTRLSCVKPSLSTLVKDKQTNQVKQSSNIVRNFLEGQSVWARDYRRGRTWCKAVIDRTLGSRTYEVRTLEGQTWRRHMDQLRRGEEKVPDHDDPLRPIRSDESSDGDLVFGVQQEDDVDTGMPLTDRVMDRDEIQQTERPQIDVVRKSQRQRKQIERLNL